MKQLLLFIIASFLLFGCASSTARKSISMETNNGTTIVLDSGLTRGEMVAWLDYAATRAGWIDDKFFKAFPSETHYRYIFEEEYEARYKMADIWAIQKDRMLYGDNAYLDDISSILQEGFLKEYVWKYFKTDQWVQPAGLRMDIFNDWFEKKHAGHVPITRAKIIPK